MLLPRKANLYIAGLAGCASTALTVSLLRHPSIEGHSYWLDVAWFGALFLLAEAFPVRMPKGGAYSVSFVIALAAIVTWQGPQVAGVAALFGALAIRGSIAKRLFNGSQFVIGTTLAGLAYRLVADAMGIVDLLPSITPPHRIFASATVLLPLVAAAVVYFVVNTWLVAFVISIVERSSALRVWVDQFSSLAGGYLAFALLGYLLGALNIEMGPAAVLFLLVPLLVARNAFQASVQMHTSYETTVRSLITAIEVKDSYTRGHAERVARLAEMAAREHGLREDQIRLVRFAALMHDIGKLGISTRVLQKPGKLTAEEYEHMKLHPLRGHEIVGEIDFLRDAVGAVRHHHERMDGGGYPDGLVGHRIPLLARIIMVADAFDSMTSTRVYRRAKSFDDAFAEMTRCAGTQFDPVCLDALQRGVAKYGWEAFPEADIQESETRATMAAL